jgi:hypothetical protein
MEFVAELERRTGARRKQQLPCRLLIGGRSVSGTVRDLSAGGVFVETTQPLPGGAGVIVSFRVSGAQDFVLEARSPRHSQVSNTLDGLAARGCALRLQDPPKSYLRWLESAD